MVMVALGLVVHLPVVWGWVALAMAVCCWMVQVMEGMAREVLG